MEDLNFYGLFNDEWWWSFTTSFLAVFPFVWVECELFVRFLTIQASVNNTYQIEKIITEKAQSSHMHNARNTKAANSSLFKHKKWTLKSTCFRLTLANVYDSKKNAGMKTVKQMTVGYHLSRLQYEYVDTFGFSYSIKISVEWFLIFFYI